MRQADAVHSTQPLRLPATPAGMAFTPNLNLLTAADVAGAESMAAGSLVRDEPHPHALLALHQAGIGATVQTACRARVAP